MKILRSVVRTFFSSGILLIIFLAFACQKNRITPPFTSIPTHGIIPLPRQLDFTGEKIAFDQTFTFVDNPVFPVAAAAAYLAIKNILTTCNHAQTVPAAGNSFQLISDNTIKDDAYQLLITKSGILVRAGNQAGAFWAIQSLKQYLWNCTGGLKQKSFDLAGIKIADEPKYGWRGFHLDVSRHFFTKAYILKIIDWLAYYKYNRFHMHLSDDQGWRIESKVKPLLNSIGAWRYLDWNDSIWSSGSGNPDYLIDPQFLKKVNGRTLYGGYYTQADITEIVGYAKNHFIEIVPEIDMPGHMSAAIRAYPALSCTGAPGMNGDYSYPICPCNQAVYDLADQIWDEITPLFPSNYVHIGADEVVKKSWGASVDCKEFMATQGISDTTALQSYFVKSLQSHLEAKGKTVVAWDDVAVEPNLGITLKFDSKLKIMYWRGWMNRVPAIVTGNGNDLIYTNWDMFYLSSDNTQAQLQKLLEFDIASAYPPNVSSKVIGFQGCVWTEKIPSEKVLESLIFPRLQALAEVNWSAYKNMDSFTARLAPHVKYMKANGVNYKF